MQIIFLPTDTADDLMNYSIDEIQSSELESIKADLSEIDSSYSLKELNLGVGADWVTILAVINGVVSVFMLGDKIEKGIEGWIKIAKRIKSVCSQSGQAFVDKDAASLLALEFLAKEMEISSLRKINEHTIILHNVSGTFSDRSPDDFISQPWAVYIMTFIVNDSIFRVLAIRFDGSVKEVYSFKHSPFGFTIPKK